LSASTRPALCSTLAGVADDRQVATRLHEVDGASPGRDLPDRGRREVVGDDHAVEAQVTADHPVDDGGREGRLLAGVDPGVDDEGHHDHVDARVDGRPEAGQPGIAAGRRGVHHAGGEVGVAADLPDPGEVLDGGGDPRVVHAVVEGHHLLRHHRGR
jgi:hypothetical protein